MTGNVTAARCSEWAQHFLNASCLFKYSAKVHVGYAECSHAGADWPQAWTCLKLALLRVPLFLALTTVTAGLISPFGNSTGMDDRFRAGIPPRYVTKPTRSTQPCIPPGSLNRVPALIGRGKDGNVTSLPGGR